MACAQDLPSPHDRAPGIIVAAVLPREDARDVLILPSGHAATTLAELPPGTRVGTSAPRRAARRRCGDRRRRTARWRRGRCRTALAAHPPSDTGRPRRRAGGTFLTRRRMPPRCLGPRRARSRHAEGDRPGRRP
ncbi:hypothetical protein [Streptomyces sp. ZAF1911]|uniref:hypothetical protein n=1 Tax=Streptomyces sp. ZAF1911 TaxID=2944129 RepID=UPI003FD66D41